MPDEPTPALTRPRDRTDEAPAACSYSYDGSSTTYSDFDGTTLSGIKLTPGTVAIFRIAP